MRIIDEGGDDLQSDGSFAPGENWLAAYLTNPGATATDFFFDAPVLPAGTYQVWARATDEAGNTGVATSDDVAVTGTDVTAPSVTVTSPTSGQAFVNDGSDVTGVAADLDGPVQTGIASGEIRITDASGDYLQVNGFFAASETWLSAELANSGAASTGYALDATDVPAGTYSVSVRAVDPSGNLSPTASASGVTVTTQDLVLRCRHSRMKVATRPNRSRCREPSPMTPGSPVSRLRSVSSAATGLHARDPTSGPASRGSR